MILKKCMPRFGVLLAVFASLFAVSCQNDIEKEFVEALCGAPKFILEISNAPDSRTVINGARVSWADGDVISILYGADAKPIPFTVNVEKGGGAVASTETTDLGWEQGNTFYAIYPHIAGVKDIHRVAIGMETSFLQIDANATNIGEYDIMVAEPVVWSNNEPRLKFHHAVSFINFNLVNDSNNAMTIYGVEFSTEQNTIPVYGTIDITLSPANEDFAKISPMAYSNKIEVTPRVECATLQPGESITLKAAIIPTDLSEQLITVTFKTSTGDTKIETYGKEFKPGVLYRFNKSMGWDGSSQEVDGLSEFKFRAVNNSGLYQDIVFTKQSDNSYMTTIVPEVDLSSIVPTFDYKGKVTINGVDVYNDKTAINFNDETLVKFDNKSVKFVVKREFEVPVIYINTDDGVGVTSKEYYLGCRIRIDGKNMYEDYATVTQADSIRGRGNTTWNWYAKKPYRIKLDKKARLLGLNEGKSYVLLANYRDPSNMMNAVAFDMARYIEMPYTVNYRFVEVYLNDEYIGIYLMTEQIQQGETRVNIEKNGGILLNLDCNDGPVWNTGGDPNFYGEEFFSNYAGSKLPVGIKHPDNPTDIQIQEIKHAFGELERTILSLDYDKFSQVMDVKSYMGFFMIQEMTCNVELGGPHSMFIHRYANGKWAMGPVWDFDAGFAYDWKENHNYFTDQWWHCGDKPGQFIDGGTDFFDRMFACERYKAEFKEYWRSVSQGMYIYAMDRMNDNYRHAEKAMQRDAWRWPITKSFNASVGKLRQWLGTRIQLYNTVVDNM